MIDETLIFSKIMERVQSSDDNYWKKKLSEMKKSHIHVAIMVEPYLTKILNGVKTVESRFSQKMTTPWKKVSIGDVVILKKSGGGFVGIFEVGNVVYRELYSLDDVQMIKSQYNDKLCIEDDFWEKKKESKYVTLISISHLFTFKLIDLSFKNRQAWITFHGEDNMLLKSNDEKEAIAIYCISGKIGSGKTTVGNVLSNRINAYHYSVSDFLKKILADKGYTSPSREQLQEIGAEYIKKGWYYFCSCVLEYINWNEECPLIIDGVRHIDFLNALKLLCYPTPVYEIYLESSEETLREHINKRGFEIYNSKHIAEGEQKSLFNASDIIIDINGKSVIQIVDEIQVILSTTCKKCKVSDNMITINMLKERIDYFNLIRGWKEYHNPRDLTISINLEAAELLEIFQWSGHQQKMNIDRINKIKEELADVLIYSIDLSNACNFDITEIILNKLKMNACKYPSKNN